VKALAEQIVDLDGVEIYGRVVDVRALDTFVTCCRGQRMGFFSGSSSGSDVGKSVLLSVLARNVAADISVIGLVG